MQSTLMKQQMIPLGRATFSEPVEVFQIGAAAKSSIAPTVLPLNNSLFFIFNCSSYTSVLRRDAGVFLVENRAFHFISYPLSIALQQHTGLRTIFHQTCVSKVLSRTYKVQLLLFGQTQLLVCKQTTCDSLLQ